MRILRNKIGHEATNPTNWLTYQVNISELNQNINEVEIVLQTLGIVGTRPLYQPYGTRQVVQLPPDKPLVYMTHIYEYGVKENDSIIIEFSHSFDFFRITGEQIERTVGEGTYNSIANS